MLPQGPRKFDLNDFDFVTPESQKFLTKLIFFKIKKSEHRWHIALPEMTVETGFTAFCRLISWSEIDTSDRRKLELIMQKERSEFCDGCAEEFLIAYDVLRLTGRLGEVG